MHTELFWQPLARTHTSVASSYLSSSWSVCCWCWREWCRCGNGHVLFYGTLCGSIEGEQWEVTDEQSKCNEIVNGSISLFYFLSVWLSLSICNGKEIETHRKKNSLTETICYYLQLLVNIPVLRVDEAMAEEAIRVGMKIGMSSNLLLNSIVCYCGS